MFKDARMFSYDPGTASDVSCAHARRHTKYLLWTHPIIKLDYLLSTSVCF